MTVEAKTNAGLSFWPFVVAKGCYPTLYPDRWTLGRKEVGVSEATQNISKA